MVGLLKSYVGIIGIYSTHISASGMNIYSHNKDEILNKGKQEIKGATIDDINP